MRCAEEAFSHHVFQAEMDTCGFEVKYCDHPLDYNQKQNKYDSFDCRCYSKVNGRRLSVCVCVCSPPLSIIGSGCVA